jgi:MFS family permease
MNTTERHPLLPYLTFPKSFWRRSTTGSCNQRHPSKSMTTWRGYSSLFGTTTTQHHREAEEYHEDDGATTELSNSVIRSKHSKKHSSSSNINNNTTSHNPLNEKNSNNNNKEDEDDYVLPSFPVSQTGSTLQHQPVVHDSGCIPGDDDDNTATTHSLDIEDAIDLLGMGSFQYRIVLACGCCFAADAMEILLLSFLAVILQAEWGLAEGQVDSIISVVFAGAMLGTLALSSLGDWWGRRPVFALTAAMISVFGVATAFCTTYEQIVVARFLVGFGVGGLTVPYDALSEFMPKTYRGTNLLSTSFFWTGGSLLVPFFAWMTLGGGGGSTGEGSTGSWRAFVVLCALPCIISTVLAIFLVPESPRWLLSRGKGGKALRILRHAAAKNGRDPFLTFPEGTMLIDHVTVAELSSSVRTSSTTYQDQNDVDQQNEQGLQKRKNISCCMLCFNPKWRKMTLLLSVQWYGLAFMYYGAIMAVSIVFSAASKDTNVDDATTTSMEVGEYEFDYSAIFISSSAEIIGLIAAILSVDRFGRVRTQACTYLLGGLCILVLGLLDFYLGGDPVKVQDQEAGVDQVKSTEQGDQEEERRHLILFAFFSRMFIMAATSTTWLHTSELLPTEIRATGHGLGMY